MVHMRKSEDNLLRSGLSFHHVGPRNQTQVFRPNSKCLYPLTHLTGHDSTLESYAHQSTRDLYPGNTMFSSTILLFIIFC